MEAVVLQGLNVIDHTDVCGDVCLFFVFFYVSRASLNSHQEL